MSKLNAIQERIGGSKGELPATENFALLVTGYTQDAKNRDAVMGMRMDTGEDVTVVLRPYKSDKPLKSARAEVRDFVAKEGEISTLMSNLPTDEMRKQVLKGMKAKTEPGGTILVQRAYTERDTGTVNAGWLQSAAKYADHCQVVSNVMLRVEPISYAKRGDREFSYVNATAIATDRSQLVKSHEELKAALKEAFAGIEGMAGRPLALVRLSDGETTKAVEYMVPVKKNEETGDYLTATPGQAATMFLNTENGKQISSMVGDLDPDLRIEVIPGTRLQIGSQAKASLEKNPNGLEQVNRAYRFVKAEQDATGFTPSYIVLHSVGDDGGKVFSAVEPLSNKPAIFHSRDIQTPHFNGKPTTTLDNKEVAVHDVPSAEASDPAPGDDDDWDINDVVGAHIPAEAIAQPAPSRPRA